MDTLTALHSRTSSPRLQDPAPNKTQLDNIMKAAVRAADHALLQPWRFLAIRDEARTRLGRLFLLASLSDSPELTETQQNKILGKPLRAPLIIVVIASHNPHPKVPDIEQDLSAAAAAQNMLLAAYAQGVGAMWRTGSMAYHPKVMEGLGLKKNEAIIGYLYMGKPSAPPRQLPEVNTSDFLSDW